MNLALTAALDALPLSPGQGLPGSFLPQAVFDEMVAAASELRWTDYLRRAIQVGGLSPHARPAPLPSDPRAARWALDERSKGALETALALVDPDGLATRVFLSSLGEHLPSSARLRVFDWLLHLELDDENSGWNPSIAPLLLEFGARASGVLGADAARMGNVAFLTALLDAGLDPNALEQGRLPLMFEALCKDRFHGMRAKMDAAALLWDRGARPCASLGLGKPSSLLEWFFMDEAERLAWQPAWMVEFQLSRPYLDDVGRGPDFLLPDPADAEGFERVERLLLTASSSWMSEPGLIGQACRRVFSFQERQALAAAALPAAPASARPGL
jgi:hypothetical protein